MKVSLAAVIVLALTAWTVDADDAEPGGEVPKSVLEVLGLGSLVVDGAEEVPEVVPAAATVESPPDLEGPAFAEPDPLPAKTAAPDAAAAEAAAREAAAQTAAEVESLRECLAEIEQTVAQVQAAHQETQQQLAEARAAAQAAEQAAAQVLQTVAAFAADGRLLADQFNSRSNLVQGLSGVQGELDKLAESTGDADVAQLQTEVGKLLADRRQSQADAKQVLTDKVRQFEDLKASLAAVQQTAEQQRDALAAAETRAAESAAAVESAREQLRTALLTPHAPRSDLPAAEPDAVDQSPRPSVVTPE